MLLNDSIIYKLFTNYSSAKLLKSVKILTSVLQRFLWITVYYTMYRWVGVCTVVSRTQALKLLDSQ